MASARRLPFHEGLSTLPGACARRAERVPRTRHGRFQSGTVAWVPGVDTDATDRRQHEVGIGTDGAALARPAG